MVIGNRIVSFRPLYVSRTENGKLLLHQRKMRKAPRHPRYYKDSVPFVRNSLYQNGDVIHINDFSTLGTILVYPDMQFPVHLALYNEYSPESVNKFYVTRWQDGTLMLHTHKPVRIRDTSDYNHFIDNYSKKKWTTVNGQPYKAYVHYPGKYRWCQKSANYWSVEHKVLRDDGTYWTKQHGHFRVPEFEGSENIKFDDEEATEVMLTTVESNFYIDKY